MSYQRRTMRRPYRKTIDFTCLRIFKSRKRRRRHRSRRVEPVCSTASRIKIRQRPMPRSLHTKASFAERSRTVSGGVEPRPYATRFRWKMHVFTERHAGRSLRDFVEKSTSCKTAPNKKRCFWAYKSICQKSIFQFGLLHQKRTGF